MLRLYTILIIISLSISLTNGQSARKYFPQKNEDKNIYDYFLIVISPITDTLERYERDGQKNTPQYAQCLHDLGCNLDNFNRIDEARRYFLKALKLRSKLFGKINEDYITSLSNYAYTYFEQDDYKTAVKFQQEVVDLMDKLPIEHPERHNYICNMATFCYMADQYLLAVKYYEDAIASETQDSNRLYGMLLDLLMCYNELGDNKAYNRIWDRVSEIDSQSQSKSHHDPEGMLLEAKVAYLNGQHNQSRELFMQLMQLPLITSMMVRVYEEYAFFLNFQLHDYKNAADNYLMATKLLKEAGDTTYHYSELLVNAATMNIYAKDYSSAIQNGLQVLNLYNGQTSGDDYKLLSDALEVVARGYRHQEDYSNAMLYYQQSLSCLMAYEKSSAAIASLYQDIGDCQYSMNLYLDAIESYRTAQSIYLQENDFENASSLEPEIGNCFSFVGKDYEEDQLLHQKSRETWLVEVKKMIEESIEDLEYNRKYNGILSYANELALIGSCYIEMGELSQAVRYYNQYVVALRESVRQQFLLLDESERTSFWAKICYDLNRIRKLLFLLDEKDDAVQILNAVIYDIELLRKGILLNSSIAFSKVLLESNNEELQCLYSNIMRMEADLDSLRHKNDDDDNLNLIVKLQNQIVTNQIRLYNGCAEFADYTEYVSYRWTDVKNKLKKEDIAIEFTAIGGPEDFLPDDRTMFAFVINSQSTYPEKIRIGKIKDLKKVLSDFSCFSNINSGIEVWGNIKNCLVGKKRIYFSADALFNSVGIEYLLVDGKPISEQYEVYRLSSTKELCYDHKKISVDNIVMIGDVDYGQMSQSINKDHLSQLMSMRGFRESESGFADLPFTEKEINALASIYQKKNPLVFRRHEATEEAFRRLDDKKVNLLHISTHGSYLGHDKSTDSESMELSLLALSGANVGSDHLENDGIISAADISTLNLRECDLAVLSACQTGLGHQGDDGVFGLQRGFKNAGVHTLLITLSSVYDESTALLMEQFHKNLVKEPEKRKALVNAQQYLRSNGYDDPKYWASFILLDAIN